MLKDLSRVSACNLLMTLPSAADALASLRPDAESPPNSWAALAVVQLLELAVAPTVGAAQAAARTGEAPDADLQATLATFLSVRPCATSRDNAQADCIYCSSCVHTAAAEFEVGIGHVLISTLLIHRAIPATLLPQRRAAFARATSFL